MQMEKEKYANKIKLLKKALADIQKRHAYLFEQKPGSLLYTIPGIASQCFFAMKDGKPIFYFFHDCNLPGNIPEECKEAFEQIFFDDQ
jgi:hypothetical protein